MHTLTDAMSAADADRSFELYEKLSADIHALLDTTLENEPVEVADEVRLRLTNEFRFWDYKRWK